MLERFFGHILRRTMLTVTHTEAELGADLLEDDDMQEAPGNLTTDIRRTGKHEALTWDLIQMVEHDRQLKRLLECAIHQAAEQNPDRQTNPVYSLESYYAFVDRSIQALPWAISPAEEYSALYDRIDQSMGCFYFICNQPLEELAGKGYYHNSLMYHEPFRSWMVKLTSAYGAFLSTEDSWCEEYYLNALADQSFRLGEDLYEDPSNWKTFNDFFARRLKDPSKRPIDEPGNDRVIVSPADAVPQGLWQIDENGRVSAGGAAVKTGTLTDIAVLLGDSKYAHAFAGGTMTHTLLDVNDYHRYHFPAGGTVREVSVIPGDDAPGGVIVWDRAAGRYKEYGSEEIGWQCIETRGAVILELPKGGLAAIVPVGMCQVSSVNFEKTVMPGAAVRKGDPLGYFLFGGSDIIMIFDRAAGFTLGAEPGRHLEMGRTYGYLKTNENIEEERG